MRAPVQPATSIRARRQWDLSPLTVRFEDQVVWTGSETLEKLNTSAQTLILRNVESLCGDQQARLLEWLGGAAPRSRIISTTEHPLFGRVEAALFDAALYYRLSVVVLRFRAKTASDPRS